jgi:hypothetical protein
MELDKVKEHINGLPDSAKCTKNQVLHHLNSVTSVTTETKKPKYLKKGDIIKAMGGWKVRPCVVIKVDKDIVYAIPLSTTEDGINLCEANSRFLTENYFSKSIISVTKENALKNFVGVYDNPKNLNEAIKKVKENLINI